MGRCLISEVGQSLPSRKLSSRPRRPGQHMSQHLLQVSVARMNSRMDMRVGRHMDGHLEVGELGRAEADPWSGSEVHMFPAGLVEASELSKL